MDANPFESMSPLRVFPARPISISRLRALVLSRVGDESRAAIPVDSVSTAQAKEDTMFQSLIPFEWGGSSLLTKRRGYDPFARLHQEVEKVFEDFGRLTPMR